MGRSLLRVCAGRKLCGGLRSRTIKHLVNGQAFVRLMRMEIRRRWLAPAVCALLNMVEKMVRRTISFKIICPNPHRSDKRFRHDDAALAWRSKNEIRYSIIQKEMLKILRKFFVHLV